MQNNLWVFCVVVTHGLGHGHAVPGIDPELRGAVGLKISNYIISAHSHQSSVDLDVLPGDGDVLVPVRSVHLVGEAEHVQQLVNHDLITDMKHSDKRQDTRDTRDTTLSVTQ